MLPFSVPVLFALYIQGVLKIKCQILVPKGYLRPEACTGVATSTGFGNTPRHRCVYNDVIYSLGHDLPAFLTFRQHQRTGI
jgi:hypothetical protein